MEFIIKRIAYYVAVALNTPEFYAPSQKHWQSLRIISAHHE